MVDIVEPRSDHAEQLYRLYRDTMEGVPHSRFVPSLARFRDELLGLVPTPSLFTLPRERRLLVAEETGAARGFACLTDYKNWDGNAHRAITALYFDTEQVGGALLAACEAAAGPGDLQAFPPEHANGPIPECNAAWDGLSDRLPHVARLLVRAGYRPLCRELHLTCDLRRFPPESTPVPAGIVIRDASEHRPSLVLQAVDGEQQAGDCYFSTLAPIYEDPRAGRIGYIWGLGVEEVYRRRGIARALMGGALARLVAEGCEACWLTTGADNWAAQPLYQSLGFEVVDSSTCFGKTRV
ncbi:MAG: Acetyltransferase family [Chloroflexota bacterium]|jgi:ribosomal protein S18 acetylase RimI-like enzyme